jgi:hypothetical protein
VTKLCIHFRNECIDLGVLDDRGARKFSELCGARHGKILGLDSSKQILRTRFRSWCALGVSEGVWGFGMNMSWDM